VGKSKPSEFMIRIHPGKEIIENSPKMQITYDQIEEFDKKI
jgi:hypothetical protein